VSSGFDRRGRSPDQEGEMSFGGVAVPPRRNGAAARRR